jgi:hypothetical protein
MELDLIVSGADTSGIFVAELGRAIPAALSRAVNRAIRSGYTQTKRGIVAETGLQTKYVTPSLRIDKSAPATLTATLRSKPTPVPLVAYFLKGFRSGQGIGGRAYRMGSAPAHAFEGMFKSGYRGVFERKGKKRTELRLLFGPPIPEVVEQRHIFAAIRGRVAEVYEARRAYEIDRLIRANGKDAGGDE